MKTLAALLLSLLLPLSVSPAFAACTWNNGEVASSLEGCAPTNAITKGPDQDYSVTGGLRSKIIRITNQLIIAGSLLAVGAVVFAAVLYTTVLGDPEKVKKAKNSLQYAIIGFAVMLLSYAIVNAVVNLIYGVAK